MKWLSFSNISKIQILFKHIIKKKKRKKNTRNIHQKTHNIYVYVYVYVYAHMLDIFKGKIVGSVEKMSALQA